MIKIKQVFTFAAAAFCITPLAVLAIDDGSQMDDKFRINFAGYLPQASKIGLYLTGSNSGPINWSLVGSNCSGTENTFVANDKSSGDSFYRIDFSECTSVGVGLRLMVNGDQSAPFDISPDPYGNIKYEFFDYFRDHETRETFSNAKNNWQEGLSLTFSYVKDAGDNGAYPTNTAEASWALINILETYPAINTYYSNNLAGAKTVYDQLKVLTDQFRYVLNHNGSLAIPKFHTNVNATWAACEPHISGTCIAEPETKATYATARTLAAMARLHLTYGNVQDANVAYDQAVAALSNAMSNPVVCNQPDAFGGEGGFYPDNDNTSLIRDPKSNNDNCVADKNNTEDDQYAALVEVYLAAEKLNKTADASNYKMQVSDHQRFNEASSYWWGAVAMEGGLSLLTNENSHSINLDGFKSNLLLKASAILGFQSAGYPGVTWDPNSTQWNTGDQDNVDNNVRWGSHRMALNDARILMAAAEVESSRSNSRQAATYARGAVNVLDHMAGVNAINLAMFTAAGYPQFEHAVTRTHDGANPTDSWPGKLVLGPNNWTNANDGAMPEFGSQPGLKMFALTGTGWSSREISIDANASLVPVSYFATEVAPTFFAASPIGSVSDPDPAIILPSAPIDINATITNSNEVNVQWRDGGSMNSIATSFAVYLAANVVRPSEPATVLNAGNAMWTSASLNSNTTYSIWVEARNSEGRALSQRVEITTPADVIVDESEPVRLGFFSWAFWLTLLALCGYRACRSAGE
jgi:hypothetical protein